MTVHGKSDVNSKKYLNLPLHRKYFFHLIGYAIVSIIVMYFIVKLYFDQESQGWYNRTMNRVALTWFHQYFNTLLVFESPKRWQTPILPIDELFPNYKLLQDNWKDIRDEAIAIMNDDTLVKPSTFYSKHIAGLVKYSERVSQQKNPWKWSILRFYGDEYLDTMNKCPKTAKLIRQLPEMDLAMFSIMDAGTTLPVHRGFFRGVTRFFLPLIVPGYDYHTGRRLSVSDMIGNITFPAKVAPRRHSNNTITPQPEKNVRDKECKIVIGENLDYHFGKYRGSDGNLKITPMVKTHSSYYEHPTVAHYFQPGVPLLWDDTYAHSVSNHLDGPRIVLLGDIRRPRPPGVLGIGQMLFDFSMKFGLVQYFYLQNSKQEKAIKNASSYRRKLLR